MSDFVISTQYLENYGAHVDDGKFETGKYHYKFKPGEDFLVRGFDRIQDAVAYIAEKYCSVDSPAGKEFPRKWRNYDDWMAELAEHDEEYRQFLLDRIREVEYTDV